MKKIDLINMIGMLIGILVNIVISQIGSGCYFLILFPYLL